MARRRNQWLWAGVGAAATGSAGVFAQRRHMARIGADPAGAELRSMPRGEPITVRSRDDTLLHAEVFEAAPGAGNARGGENAQGPRERTFVLVHGWTETLACWTYVIRTLTQSGFRVVAYDLRGHGDSQPAADGDYAIARFGEDFDAILAAAVPDEETAIAVGHSLGAMALVAWAERHEVQPRVSALALLNTGVGDLLAEHLLVPVPWLAQFLNRTVPPRLWVGMPARFPRFSSPLTYGLARYLAFGPTASPAQIAFYERMLIACPPDVRADVGIALSELELYDALPRLTVPTLLLAGENDKLTPPSHARRIAELVPSLDRLVVLPDTGHMAPLERPDDVTGALTELAAARARERSAT